MRIGTLAQRLGTTPHAIRFYERRGLLPPPPRGPNRYRDYGEVDVARLRLLIGLRQLDIPLHRAAALASMCASGRCDEVSDDLRALVSEKRQELARRVAELGFLDQRMAHLAGQLQSGASPRTVINHGKEEEERDTAL